MNLVEVLIEQVLENGCDKKVIDYKDVIGICPYGSKVYGSDSEDSDFDYVVIHSNSNQQNNFYSTKNLDIHFMSEDHYNELLKEHDIMAMEVHYMSLKGNLPMNFTSTFELSLPKLRKSVSSIASNSYVKAKKKMTLKDEDTHTGVKSLFHSLRIIELGIDIARGKSFMFSNKALWISINYKAEELNYNWEQLNEIYKPIFNTYMTEFRKVAPKV